jgi:hypothetical protein
MTFRTSAVAGQSEADLRELILTSVLDMIERGINVCKGNGTGQKPKDVATEIETRHGITLTTAKVLGHLNTLEREGRLAYEISDHSKRGSRAGFRKPAPPFQQKLDS